MTMLSVLMEVSSFVSKSLFHLTIVIRQPDPGQKKVFFVVQLKGAESLP